MASLVRAACLTNFSDVAIAVGLNPTRMLLDAGLSPNVLAEPDLMIPVERVGRLLQACATASGNESFGLLMAKTRLLSNMGPVGMLIRDQATLRDSLNVLVRYLAQLNGALTLVVEEAETTTVIREVLLAGSTHQPTRQRIELALGVMVQTVRQLVGPSWMPRRVCFEHPAPRDLSTHTQVFGPAIVFDSDFNGIVCATADLDIRNPYADPAMQRYTMRLMGQADATPDASLLSDVRRAIVLLLPSGRCSIEVVAEHMGVAPRTVQRRLSDLQQSFSVLLNDVRQELAVRYVLESDRSLTDVAELLGFTAPSSFSRWYQAQFGMSAKESRTQAVAKNTPPPPDGKPL